jgi:uncharacterized membrane protein YbaN (DUF454 family)
MASWTIIGIITPVLGIYSFLLKGIFVFKKVMSYIPDPFLKNSIYLKIHFQIIKIHQLGFLNFEYKNPFLTQTYLNIYTIKL